jgi:hypothetical protein
MPTLPLSGEGVADRLTAWATMLFPGEKEERQKFFAVMKAKHLSKEGKTAEMDPELLDQVIQAESLDALLKKAETRKQRGIFAGIVLLLTLKQQGMNSPSKTKAAEATLKGYKHHVPEAHRRDESKDWKKYKDVSHYWAAYIVLRGENVPFEDVIGDKMPVMLAVGEKIRRWAEKFQCSRRESALLDPEKTWKAPKEYDLPAVELHLPETDSELAEVIDSVMTNR